MADPKRLKSITGCTPGQFAFLLELFESYIKSATDMPLFRGDARHAGKPGKQVQTVSASCPFAGDDARLCRSGRGFSAAVVWH